MDVAEASLIVVSVWVTSLFFALVLGHWLEMAKDEGRGTGRRGRSAAGHYRSDQAGAADHSPGQMGASRRSTDSHGSAPPPLPEKAVGVQPGPASGGADISTPYFIFVR